MKIIQSIFKQIKSQVANIFSFANKNPEVPFTHQSYLKCIDKQIETAIRKILVALFF